MVARYETPFELSLHRAQTVHLADHGGNRSQLTVRVRADRIEAGWPANDTFDHPPRFDGRIEVRPDGVQIAGTIRESWSNMAWARIWAMPTVLFLAICVGAVIACIVSSVRAGLEALLFGAVGTIVFALMWRWQTRLRRPAYDSDVRKLVAGLTRYLETGNGDRY